MENKNNNDLFRMIGVLEGKVETGFGAVNQRLDVSNGRITKNEVRMNEMSKHYEQRISNIESNQKMFMAVITVIWAIIQFLIPFATTLIK